MHNVFIRWRAYEERGGDGLRDKFPSGHIRNIAIYTFLNIERKYLRSIPLRYSFLDTTVGRCGFKKSIIYIQYR